jgi:hypothetical protein
LQTILFDVGRQLVNLGVLHHRERLGQRVSRELAPVFRPCAGHWEMIGHCGRLRSINAQLVRIGRVALNQYAAIDPDTACAAEADERHDLTAVAVRMDDRLQEVALGAAAPGETGIVTARQVRREHRQGVAEAVRELSISVFLSEDCAADPPGRIADEAHFCPPNESQRARNPARLFRQVGVFKKLSIAI